MSAEKLAEKIVNQLGLACGLDCTTVAIEAVEECLGAVAERDLEVWRQAYVAYLPGYAVAEQLDGPGGPGWCVPDRPRVVADRALADYRAKREEMGR